MKTHFVMGLIMFLCAIHSVFENRCWALYGPRSASHFSRSEGIRTVSFCDLVGQPALYENKTVRIRAMIVSTFDNQYLYDPRCPDQENYVWPILDCRANSSCKVLQKRLNESLKGDPFSGMRTELVFVGRLKELKADHRYGVQGGYRLAFTIERIEAAKPLPKDARSRKENE
jgi:hypothetical protein